MGNIYPYVETLKVFAAYMALLCIWPCIIFRYRMKGRGLTYRFLFCSTMQIVLLNGVVLGLGIFHILNVWIVRLLFWGAPVVSAGIPMIKHSRRAFSGELKSWLAVKHQWKLFFYLRWENLMKTAKKLWRDYKGLLPEYAFLSVILLFGIAFFSNGAFQDYSYGCYDQYTHHTWVLRLMQGEVFPSGIYPEAMHCFIYGMHCLFGVSLYSCMLFLPGIHILTFLLAAYCLLKEIFQSHYTPLFVLAAWLTFDGIGAKVLESMTRLTWALPQEFGMYQVFLCPLFLIRYFREKKKVKQWFENENLVLLMLGVGAAVSLHFYTLILAFFSCVAVILIYLKELWPIKKMRPLLLSVLCGLEAGIFPMLIAYAMGRKFEGSLQWGFHTIQGASKESSRIQVNQTIFRVFNGNFFKDIYEKGYVSLFGSGYAWKIVLLSIFMIAICGMYSLFLHNGKKHGQVPLLPAEIPEGYVYLTLTSAVFVFLFAAPVMGLPEFVVIDRTVGITQMMIWGTAGAAVDSALILVGIKSDQRVMRVGTVVLCGMIYCFAYLEDFHEYTYWWLRRYNAAVLVTDEITEKFSDNSYTIVSMWDESYQMEGGDHEELLTFVQGIDSIEYFLPTEYVFLYVEKRPLLRGQVHFLTGPSWLGRDNDTVFEALENQSQCPEILHGQISWEAAQETNSYFPSFLKNYDNLEMRTVLCSKAYYWYSDFAGLYPAETNIYYEDEDFVCYVIHQNPDLPFNLAL